MTTDRTGTDDADGDRESADTSATDTDHDSGSEPGAVSPSDSDTKAQPESTASDETPPGEWDPEASYRDSSTDSLTIPQVETEDAGSTFMDDLKSEHEHEFEIDSGPVSVPEVSTAESDVPTELLKVFWGIVLVLNAAILAVALGLMFMLFEGVSQMAVALVVGGAVLFGFAYYRYQSYQNRTDEFSVADSDELDDESVKAGVDGDERTDTGDTPENGDDLAGRTDSEATEAEHSGSNDDADTDRQY
ncbi:hypothetical protein C482_17648 [Natrialba chahannaoensis JCM 10990]|uniref:DUF7322 domain-containing protein n=1 Tax=Natrialba chahannaoensis JCM 10990 TaxID=1227492 RepID=M0A973_9EURY|nr:hypothetical protein [Natrialba chahannaoensis]ELY94921.1 hypothetical protein C482_17648 [Natrialba chahannaoensis JCM 10990]